MLNFGAVSRRRLAMAATSVVVVAAAAVIVVAIAPDDEGHQPRAAGLSSVVASAVHVAFSPLQHLTDVDLKHAVTAAMLEVTNGKASERPKTADGIAHWPSNVTRVLAMRDTHADALRFVGAGPSQRGPADTRNVLVVRAFGTFDVPITGPPGSSHHARGTVLTFVVDPLSGDVYDFGVDRTPATTPALPNPTEIH